MAAKRQGGSAVARRLGRVDGSGDGMPAGRGLWRALALCCVGWLLLPVMDCEGGILPTPPPTTGATEPPTARTTGPPTARTTGPPTATTTGPPPMGLLVLERRAEKEATGRSPTNDKPKSCSFRDKSTIREPCRRELRPGQSIDIICPARPIYAPVDWRRGDIGEVCLLPITTKNMQPHCTWRRKWIDITPVAVLGDMLHDKTFIHTITLLSDYNNNTVGGAAAGAASTHHGGGVTVHGACYGGAANAEHVYWSIQLMPPKTEDDNQKSNNSSKTEDDNQKSNNSSKTEDDNQKSNNSSKTEDDNQKNNNSSSEGKNTPSTTTTTKKAVPTMRFEQGGRKADEVVIVALRKGESFEVTCDEAATINPPDALKPDGGHFCRSLTAGSSRPCPTGPATLWSSSNVAVEVAAKTTTAKGVKATIVVEGKPTKDGDMAVFSCTRRDGVMSVFYLSFRTAAAPKKNDNKSVETPQSPRSPIVLSLKRCPKTSDDDDDDEGVSNGKEIFLVKKKKSVQQCDVELSPYDVLLIDCHNRFEVFPPTVAKLAGSFCSKPFPAEGQKYCDVEHLVPWNDVLQRWPAARMLSDDGMFVVVNTSIKRTPFVAYGGCSNPTTGDVVTIAATFRPRPNLDDGKKTSENDSTNKSTDDSSICIDQQSSEKGRGSMANASSSSLFLAAVLSVVLAAVAGGL